MKKVLHRATTYDRAFQHLLQLLSAAWLFLMICTPSLADIANIDLWENDNKTRLVLDLTRLLPYKVFSLRNPPRLVFDLATQNPNYLLSDSNPDSNLVRRIRSGVPRQGIFRIVLDLSGDAKFTLSEPVKVAGGFYRLFIDIYVDDAQLSRASIRTHPDTHTKDRYVVVLDPGHGGKDPGAIGQNGMREKDIVLNIANILADILDAETGVEVALTRSEDKYVELRNRLRLANEVTGDIFISLHADAFNNSSVAGASVYSLSQSGATSEMAAYLAKRENAADLTGGVSLSQRDALLAETMLDMQLDWKLAESDKLGAAVLRELGALGPLHSRRVEQAGFVVLKAPAIPSVLIEVGYITNSSDARRLRKKETQHEIAAAILRAILRYCHGSPECPLQRYKEVVYIVKKGDSLSKIAVRLGSEASLIKRWNGLMDSVIHPQQKLLVPLITP